MALIHVVARRVEDLAVLGALTVDSPRLGARIHLVRQLLRQNVIPAHLLVSDFFQILGRIDIPVVCHHVLHRVEDDGVGHGAGIERCGYGAKFLFVRTGFLHHFRNLVLAEISGAGVYAFNPCVLNLRPVVQQIHSACGCPSRKDGTHAEGAVLPIKTLDALGKLRPGVGVIHFRYRVLRHQSFAPSHF